MAPKFKQSIREDWLNRLDTLVGASGKIRIYDGTRPTTVDTALGAQVVLAELPCSADVFAAAVAGEPTYVDLNAITNDSSADATGTATWASILSSANVRMVDMDVGTSGSDLNLNTTAIVTGATVSITSMRLRLL